MSFREQTQTYTVVVEAHNIGIYFETAPLSLPKTARAIAERLSDTFGPNAVYIIEKQVTVESIHNEFPIYE